MKFLNAATCLLAASLTASLYADNARFDLTGPKIDVRVTRGTSTLPISEVPNLQTGDKLWVKADLPTTQSNHLLMIVAFLRGTTNEPPDNWFTEIDTWDKKTAEGTTVTVPDGAEEALLFIAPETGGDFKTLRSAVKGRPGVFIRADADLNQASFEQQRIERYLAAMKGVSGSDPKAIQDHSSKLASTLALKPNADCFKQPVDQQVTCLTQSSAPVLMDDGHGQTIADAFSTGPSSDFINTASYTQAAGAGVYSAYVGAVVDLVHLVSTLRTAQYQYIPGLSFPQDSTLNLKLNAPPSFNTPKTVIVVGLPAIQKAVPPPLHAHDPNQVACLLQPDMALQLEGAPLVFSSSFAHDLVLHLNRTSGATDLPLKPDAFEGGLVLSKDDQRKSLGGAKPENTSAASGTPDAKLGTDKDLTITGTVHGYWGFDPFDGPTLTIQQVAGKGWKIVSKTQLITGQDNHITLQGDGTGCVQHIALTNSKAKDVDVSFKPSAGEGGKITKDTLDLDVSLKTVQPGGYSLAIKQYGDSAHDEVALTAYTGDIHFDALTMHTGDNTAVVTGHGLQDIVSVQIADKTFTPATAGNTDTSVNLHADSGVSPADGSNATVKLKDGRTMPVKISAGAARPGLKLLFLTATMPQADNGIPVTLGSKDDIPLRGRLTFVVQTDNAFPRSQTVEVATEDGSIHTSLSLASNNLVLQDEHTAIATLEPLKAFGQSAFGKLQMRPVSSDNTAGDWTPLGTLVRTPQITAIHCTTPDAPTCTVDGSNFFLVQSFGATKDFAKPADVPTGFADNTFTVPTPSDGSTMYLKLRDDPNAVATVVLPTPIQKPAATDTTTHTPTAPEATSGSTPLPTTPTGSPTNSNAPISKPDGQAATPATPETTQKPADSAIHPQQ